MSAGAHTQPARVGAQAAGDRAERLTFSRDPFDRERYTSCRSWRRDAVGRAGKFPPSGARLLGRRARLCHAKVDVRGGVFDGDQVLLVRERSDGRWTLPGGWWT